MTKEQHDALMQGFHDGLTKEALLPALAGIAARATPMLARVGTGLVRGAGQLAKGVGGAQASQAFGSLVSKGVRASGGQASFMRNVGGAALGAGAVGAAGMGAGYLAGRS
jgi:hypothetical protein